MKSEEIGFMRINEGEIRMNNGKENRRSTKIKRMIRGGVEYMKVNEEAQGEI